jgi:putative phage-type endonuclease
MIEVIRPRDRDHWLSLRAQDITSTESPALFDLSPYATHFEVWHRHRSGSIVQIEQNEAMEWGTRLEDPIAIAAAERLGMEAYKFKDYIRDPETRTGSSFDYFVGDDGIIECKVVSDRAFRENWIEDGDRIEAPPHIEIQVQHQLLVSDRKWAKIAALIGGNRLVIVHREREENIIRQIKTAVRLFWQSIDENREPKPDFQKDAEFIASLYSYAEPGKRLDLREDQEILDLLKQYKNFSDTEKEAKEAKDGVKAQLLMRIGDAERADCGECTISAGIVGEAEIAYKRAAYRNFKVSWRKQK